MPKQDDLERMRARMRALSGRSGRSKPAAEADTRLETVRAKKSRSEAARRSKTKGSTYERRIAAKFGAWCGEKLRRTPQSGGWHGGEAHGVSGDLICDNPKFPFHIECKKREGWTLEDLIIGVRSGITDTRSILGWWNQTLRTCPRGKEPMLVFSRNRVPDLVMMRRTDMTNRLVKENLWTVELLAHYTFALDSGEIAIFSLDDFFAKVRPPKGCSKRKKWKSQPTPTAVEED